MQYNVYDGKQLLNRISVIYDYLNKCEQRSHNKNENSSDVSTDFIMFMNSGICNHEKLSYNNESYPGAFDTNIGITLPKVSTTVTAVISKQWKQILKVLHIYWPQTLIAEQKTLSQSNLIKLTEMPNEFVQWKHNHVVELDIEIFVPMIQQLFKKDLIKELIKDEPDIKDASEIKSPMKKEDHTETISGVKYNFTSTEEFLNDKSNKEGSNSQ